MKSDSKEKNLYWRGDAATFRLKLPGIDGREIWESFGAVSPDVARLLTKKKRRELLDTWALEKHKLIVPEQRLSTFLELYDAYKSWAAGARIADRTVRENENALRRFVREAAGEAAEEGSLDILTPQLITRYEAARLTIVKAEAKKSEWTPEQLERALDQAQTTVASTLRQARSVFSRKARSSDAYRKLKLPATLDAFMAHAVDGSSLKNYERPDAAIVKKVLGAIPALRQTDPAMWLAAMVEINAAARRSTAVNSRWDWFVDEGRVCPLTEKPLVSFRVQVAKGNRSAPVVFRDMYEEMLAARGDARPYIVPGDTEKDRQEVFTRLVKFLRELGLDRRQPNHELRKLYTDDMLDTHGENAALAATGHSDARMLRAYTQRRGKFALRLA